MLTEIVTKGYWKDTSNLFLKFHDLFLWTRWSPLDDKLYGMHCKNILFISDQLVSSTISHLWLFMTHETNSVRHTRNQQQCSRHRYVSDNKIKTHTLMHPTVRLQYSTLNLYYIILGALHPVDERWIKSFGRFSWEIIKGFKYFSKCQVFRY